MAGSAAWSKNPACANMAGIDHEGGFAALPEDRVIIVRLNIEATLRTHAALAVRTGRSGLRS